MTHGRRLPHSRKGASEPHTLTGGREGRIFFKAKKESCGGWWSLMENDVEEGRTPDVLGVSPRFFGRRTSPIGQKIVHKIKAAPFTAQNER